MKDIRSDTTIQERLGGNFRLRRKCIMPHPALDRLNELFACDAEAGVLRWKISGRGIRNGAEAGSVQNKGRYRYVSVDGNYFTVANIVWFIHYGEWPKSRIAPKNGNQSDCRITNLVLQRSLTGAFDHSTQEGRIAYNRAHRKEYPDHYRNKELLRDFNLSLIEYNEMLEKQNGVCAICEKQETSTRNGKTLALHVDHNHETGDIRGLLCSNCNVALGMFRDDADLMRNAVVYLAKHSPVIDASTLPHGHDWLAVATLGFGA